MPFSDFLGSLFAAEYSFADLYRMVSGFYTNLWADFNISELVSGMWWHLRYVKPFLPFILFAIYAVVATFGSKMFGVLRFSSFFGVGFIIGVYTLSPLVLEVMPNLPTWVIGLITGIVSGVLSKVLYFLLFTSTLGYTAYILCYRGMIPLISGLLRGNWFVALIVMAAVIALSVIFMKYLDMALTALLGGFGMACIVRGWYDYTSLPAFVGTEWLGVFIVTLIFGALGFFVQYKSREIYK